MATRKWTTQYPANLDGDTQQPTVENRVHDIDASHTNSLSVAVRALQILVGSDNLEAGSLREQAGSVPNMTLATLNNKITDATLIDTGDVRLSDQRSANALLNRSIAITVPNNGETYIWNVVNNQWEPGIPTASEIPAMTLAELNAKITNATLIDTGDTRLSDARTPTSHAHTASEVSDFDTEVGNHSDVALNTVHRGLTNNPHSITASDVGNAIAQWNANKIQNRNVTANAPSADDVLMWNSLTETIEWGAASSGASDFLTLTDTPSTYLGQGGKIVAVSVEGSGLEFIIPSTSSDFVSLTDTPSSYEGQASKYVAVNGVGSALEFIVGPSIINNFTGLSDTPVDYEGQANKYVTVNAGGTALTFIPLPSIPDIFTDLGDTPGGYAGHAHKQVRVNLTENALEFVVPSGTAGATTFLSLSDSPSSYAGQVGKVPAVNTGASALEFISLPTVISTLIGLSDTPANYNSAADYFVKVKTDQSGLEFVAPSGTSGSTSFVALSDTPSNYSGSEHHSVRVNLTGDALEFVAPSGSGTSAFTGLSDTPGSYSGQQGKLLIVNTSEDAVLFSGIRRVLEDVFTADSPDINNRQTFTLTIATSANADTPSGRDIRGVFRNGNRQKHVVSNPISREYTVATNNQVTVGGLVTNDDIEIIYGG